MLHNTRERALAEADGELLIGSIKLQSVELARVVSLHFNVKADFGSHVTQLGCCGCGGVCCCEGAEGGGCEVACSPPLRITAQIMARTTMMTAATTII